ncbi:hypothetical protein [Marilutibacter alkalisoli]|uniref:WxL domain-containing protein n=1 Tax=Marilutibacter alkalisoli TaxID=2591633 RepID=A0A514BVW4_9GAMM|nr:hypothetical protein [Lysobacter alkalisoli]QDH71526.1 hypothetical protein FKV23_16575 [Lysobacter alkalisoli]
MNLKHSLLAAAVLAVALPLTTHANSSFIDGNGSATAHLDFQVTVPRVLLLRVGSDAGTVDLIDFDVTAADLQNAGTQTVSGTGGDLGGGSVTAHVMGNNGAITLGATTVGALLNGDGDSISYAEITTSSSDSGLPSPTLVDGTTSSVVLAPTSGSKVTDRSAQWTFEYANSALVAAGTYGGQNVNNGRVTYTAAMP